MPSPNMPAQPNREQDSADTGRQSFRQSFRNNIKTYTEHSAQVTAQLPTPAPTPHTQHRATRPHRRHQRGMASRDAGRRY
jgi:hypothetical protein